MVGQASDSWQRGVCYQIPARTYAQDSLLQRLDPDVLKELSDQFGASSHMPHEPPSGVISAGLDEDDADGAHGSAISHPVKPHWARFSASLRLRTAWRPASHQLSIKQKRRFTTIPPLCHALPARMASQQKQKTPGRAGGSWRRESYHVRTAALVSQVTANRKGRSHCWVVRANALMLFRASPNE